VYFVLNRGQHVTIEIITRAAGLVARPPAVLLLAVMDAHCNNSLIMTVLSMFILTLTAAGVAAADNVASLELRSVLGESVS